MALCTLLNHIHDKTDQLHRRLRQLSRDGNRAYGLLPLDLGQPVKDIVESDDYESKPLDVALQWWLDSERDVRDRNRSNSALVRVHPVAAGKQCFPSCARLQMTVSCLDEIQ